MASPDNKDALAKELNLRLPKSTSKLEPGALGNDKDKKLSGGTLPGWTMIMRPLKKKNRGTADAATTVTANAYASGVTNDDKTNGDLKNTPTHESSLAGVGEVETLNELRSDDGLLENDDEPRSAGDRGASYSGNNDGSMDAGRSAGMIGTSQYKTYKRRWFGLFQLVLLNIVVSWDVSAPSALLVKHPCEMLIILFAVAYFLCKLDHIC